MSGDAFADQQHDHRQVIETMAKHLPPSAAALSLLDINGYTTEVLRKLRADIEVQDIPGDVFVWPELEADSVDAVMAYDYYLNDFFLDAVLKTLRPGGRLVMSQLNAEMRESIGRRLEERGYVRILVEPLKPKGVLVRGEKAHTTTNTLDRIQQVAGEDADMLDLATYRGRYVHLLVQQTPNIPPWRMEEGTEISWQAVALQEDDETLLLGFSSLPKAVGFMQPAVLDGTISNVNKVGKFSKETAATWTLPVILNPSLEMLRQVQLTLIEVDPSTAEASDE